MSGIYSSFPKNLTIINQDGEKRKIDRVIGNRFVFRHGKMFHEDCLEFVSCGIQGATIERVYTDIRTKYVLFGKCFIVGALEFPYFSLDVSDAPRYFDEFLDLNFEFWVCDLNFHWCFEIRSKKEVYLQLCPWDRLTNCLKNRQRRY